MYKKIVFFALAIFAITKSLYAQEMQAKVTVLAARVGSAVDKNVFTNLQTQLTNLINNRKWTNDAYQTQEKIQCNFFLNIESAVEDNVYKASLTIQAARPVLNSSYQSPLVNFQDGDVTFKYAAFQPVEFNETRIQGGDALSSNLSAVFAYYIYIILGLDYDSFSPKGGDLYFQKAQNIVNNAPEGRDISGWKAFDGVRNRYWLATNITNPKYNIIHDVFYSYFRDGLDNMYDDQPTATDNIVEALEKFQTFNEDNPNLMVTQFFLQNRSDELIGIFKKAEPSVKSRAIQVLSKLDVANIAKYKEQLK